MTTPSFEIGGASYTSSKIKKSRSYRLQIEWNAADIDGKSKYTSRVVKASTDGIVEWVALSGLKRFFESLPPHISITLEQRQLMVLWKTLARYNSSSDLSLPRFEDCIDGVLGLNLVISDPAAAGAPAIVSAGNTTPSTVERPNPDAHGSPGLGLSTTDRAGTIIFEPATPFGSSAVIPPAVPPAITAQEVATSGGFVEQNVNTSVLGGSTAVNCEDAEEAATKVAEADKALGASRSNELVDAGNSASDQYSRIEPLKGDFLGAFPDPISVVEGLLKLGDLIAEIHPIAKVIVGVLKGAWTIMQANAQTNEHMHTLLDCMKDLCVHTQQYAASKEHEPVVQDIVKDISYAVMSGATLIKRYAEDQKQKNLLRIPTFFKTFEQDADAIIETLTSLTTKLQGAAVASVFDQVHQISARLHSTEADVDKLVKNDVLSILPCAMDAASTLHDGNGYGCLPGTRTAVLEALQTWATGGQASVDLHPTFNPPTEHKLDLAETKVLWLQGVAGSGKSSIAASVAKFFEHADVLMAYYRFETAKQGLLNPSNLFTTIALQLAAQHAVLEARLVELVNLAAPLEKKSQDPSEQLKLFLLPLLEQGLRGYKQVVIIIDALDESGGIAERSKLIKPLVSIAEQLPSAVCILVTTRPEPDIQEGLLVSPPLLNMAQLFMHELPESATKDDIHQYIKHKLTGPPLNGTPQQFSDLAERAELSFQWASTACLYIVDKEDGKQAVGPLRRLKNVLSSSGTSDSHHKLYKLYHAVLDAQFGSCSSDELKVVNLLLGVIVVARRPLSLVAVLELLDGQLEQYGDLEIVKEEAVMSVGLLSSLMTGTKPTSVSTPLLPLHASFFDFLQAANTQYQVDLVHTHQVLTESCFMVMLHGIPDLSALIQDKIGDALCYACHFWSSHLNAADMDESAHTMVEVVGDLLCSVKFLYWLEVMSLTGMSALQTLSMIPAKLGSRTNAAVAEAAVSSAFTAYRVPSNKVKSIVECVVVSQHNLLAAGLENGSIILWDSQSGQRYGDQLTGHTRGIQAMAFSPDGAVLASGSSDETIRLWDVHTQASKGQPLTGHTEEVTSVAFSPDGAVLASCSDDTSIRLWDVHTQTAKGQPLTGHTDYVRSVVFSPDGAVLASGLYNESIRLWDVQTQAAKGQPLTGHTGYVTSVAFSPDGAVLASGSHDESIRLWDVHTQSAKGEPFGAISVMMHSLAFFHDGKLLASGAADGSIHLWDLSTFLSSQIVVPLPVPESSHLTATWQDLKLLDNGWVKGPNGELVLWVPPYYRTNVYHPNLITALGKDPSEIIKLDFDHMVVGEQWAHCHILQSS
ncbi:hypothetical protein DL93DRAFT_2173397 [Clavulina sp. PMI_390]|nr:hypothetical protein DL93DRAFT_2173397 [Clavulina sp. PMI_390]